MTQVFRFRVWFLKLQSSDWRSAAVKRHLWHLLPYPCIKCFAQRHTSNRKGIKLVHPTYSTGFTVCRKMRVKVEHHSATFHVLSSRMIFLSLQLVGRQQVSDGKTLSCSCIQPSNILRTTNEGSTHSTPRRGGGEEIHTGWIPPPTSRVLPLNTTQDLELVWVGGWGRIAMQVCVGDSTPDV